MASEVQICNRALQKLGAGRITALTEDSPNARNCNVAYEDLRDRELRAHPWSFSIKRKSVAKDSDSPAYTYDNQFTMPSDCIRLLAPDPELNFNDLDWHIEGRQILTDSGSPLKIRYIARITDPNVMDPLFREALASRIAYELCEPITQSNTKRQLAWEDYKNAIEEARKVNSIEKPVSAEPPTDEWITVRL